MSHGRRKLGRFKTIPWAPLVLSLAKGGGEGNVLTDRHNGNRESAFSFRNFSEAKLHTIDTSPSSPSGRILISYHSFHECIASLSIRGGFPIKSHLDIVTNVRRPDINNGMFLRQGFFVVLFAGTLGERWRMGLIIKRSMRCIKTLHVWKTTNEKRKLRYNYSTEKDRKSQSQFCEDDAVLFEEKESESIDDAREA